MGYFPTGHSIRWFQEAFCHRCIHEQCPLWMLQLRLNREEANKDSILHHLIPTSPEHQECRMFYP